MFEARKAKYSVPWSEINDRRNTVAEEGLTVYYAAQKPDELVEITEYVGISIAFVYIRVTDLWEKSVVAALTKPSDVIKQPSYWSSIAFRSIEMSFRIDSESNR